MTELQLDRCDREFLVDFFTFLPSCFVDGRRVDCKLLDFTLADFFTFLQARFVGGDCERLTLTAVCFFTLLQARFGCGGSGGCGRVEGGLMACTRDGVFTLHVHVRSL